MNNTNTTLKSKHAYQCIYVPHLDKVAVTFSNHNQILFTRIEANIRLTLSSDASETSFYEEVLKEFPK